MIPNTFGDMTRQLFLGRQSADLKGRQTVLAHEMTHGQAYDKANKLEGRLSILAGLEQSHDRAETRQTNAQTVLQLLETQQSVVSGLASISDRALAMVVPSIESGNELAFDRSLAEGRESFAEAIGLLNTRLAGRSLFAGSAGGEPAVADAAQILDALVADAPTPMTAEDLSAFVDDWFGPGGGFDTAGYLGSAGVPAPIQLGQGRTIRLDVTAQDPALRQTLAALAKSALFEKLVPNATANEKRSVLERSRAALSGATNVLVDLGARLGSEEEKAATAKIRAESEKTSLSIARAELLSSDPYEAASRLEQNITLLDTIHALTARLSRLSLANYLR